MDKQDAVSTTDKPDTPAADHSDVWKRLEWLTNAPDRADYPNVWTWLVAAGEKARKEGLSGLLGPF